MQTIGKKIRELRIKADMTQKSLAKALGISPSAVGMYEQDRREPDSHILGSMCRIFGVSGDYFIGEYDTAASDGMEVSAVFDEFTRRLAVQEGLMFDGVPLTQDDRRKIGRRSLWDCSPVQSDPCADNAMLSPGPMRLSAWTPC